jgi:hypothetical protein
MATIPQEELTTLGLIHQDLKTINASVMSNGGAIVGLGAMLAQMNTVLLALLKQGGMEEAELETLQAALDKLVADFATPPNVAFLGINNGPVNKEIGMAAKLFSLGIPGTVDMTNPAVTNNTATMEPLQADGVTPAVLAPGDMISHVVAPGVALTIVPSADSLSYVATRVAGQQGVEVVTSSYTNPDGTVVSNTNTYTIGAPANLDVASINISNSAPV